MKDVFARPLPGVYALHDQVPSPTQLLSAPPPYMLRVDQLRLYALARRAGEPWGSYPLWLPESEYLWCVWAQEHADPELFQSLLSIVQLDAWPEVEGLEGWRVGVTSHASVVASPSNSRQVLDLSSCRRLNGC